MSMPNKCDEVDISMTDNDIKPEIKKKNPYSIEELLKKPEKQNKPLEVTYSSIQQPYGILVSTMEEDSKSLCDDLEPVNVG